MDDFVKILKVARTKHLWAFLTLVAFFTAQPTLAPASMTTKTQINYYNIKGKTTQQLKWQMKNNGPNGYWAYVNWYVNLKTGSCHVSLKIKYTYPRWSDIHQAPKSLQQKWRRMIFALKKHEKGHARHGVEAAREINRNNCKNPQATIDKWAAQDKIFDQRTKHGLIQGVILP